MKRYHRNRPVTLLAVFVLFFIHFVPVQATLISKNSLFGADTITRDSDTGLEWLDVPITAGISFNDVENLLTTDARYSGFRFASSSEIVKLFDNAGIVNYTPIAVFKVRDLQQRVGVTETFYYNNNAWKWVTQGWAGDLDPQDPSQRYTARLSAYFAPTQPSAGGSATLDFAPVADQSIADPTVGSWLVRSTIDEPSILFLLALGGSLVLMGSCLPRK